jgi:hypothetical protein
MHYLCSVGKVIDSGSNRKQKIKNIQEIMFTAKVITPDGQTKFIANCSLYKGRLTQTVQIGQGKPVTKGGMFNGEGDTWDEYPSYKDGYKAYFNSYLLKKDNLISEAKKDCEVQGWTPQLMDKWLTYMFTLGENEGGYLVINTDEEKEQKEKEKHELLLNKKEPVKVGQGIFGYLIHDRLPAEMWALVKPFANYHRGDDEDMEWAEDMGYYNPTRGELKGWYYTDGAIEALFKAGYLVSYRGQAATVLTDIVAIDKQMNAEYINKKKRHQEVNQEAIRLQDLISNAPSSEVSEKEIKAVESLNKITLLGYKGPNIYGGGKWLHVLGNDLYVVHNNGADGDDWGRNNYQTGGAGAICIKKPGQAHVVSQIQSWIESLGEEKEYMN